MEEEKEKIWIERMPHESAKAFAYFNIYLDLGYERTLKKVREKTGNKISRRQLTNYSKKYKWKKRINAKEEYEVKQKNKKKEEEKEKYFKKRMQKLEEYHKATDEIIKQFMIELGIEENPETKRKQKNPNIQTTRIANSLKNLTDANVNNTKLALRFLNLPETIKDVQEVNVDARTQNKTEVEASVDVKKTLNDPEFLENELKFMKELIKTT